MPGPTPSFSSRYDRIDALRGAAVVWMTIFHFSFDLNYFHWTHQDFYRDPVWTWQRTAIVSLFLFCAGLGQAVAFAQDIAWPRFWKRWAKVAGCALLVTAGSYFMFPRSFIYFGVLHGIALMLIVMRLTRGWGKGLWLAGAVAIGVWLLAPWAHSQWPALDVLNDRAWNWIGFISRKPVTEDYVPLLPWLGVMWWGVAAGEWMMSRHRAWLSQPIAHAKPLTWLGRWSLAWYMLHQPVMIGVLAAVQALRH